MARRAVETTATPVVGGAKKAGRGDPALERKRITGGDARDPEGAKEASEREVGAPRWRRVFLRSLWGRVHRCGLLRDNRCDF